MINLEKHDNEKKNSIHFKAINFQCPLCHGGKKERKKNKWMTDIR